MSPSGSQLTLTSGMFASYSQMPDALEPIAMLFSLASVFWTVTRASSKSM